MQPLYGCFSALAVTAIYYVWRAYIQSPYLQERALHQRVAYMLWIMANQVEA
jgi:hypothetical protein